MVKKIMQRIAKAKYNLGKSQRRSGVRDDYFNDYFNSREFLTTLTIIATTATTKRMWIIEPILYTKNPNAQKMRSRTAMPYTIFPMVI
jgi:hypothetical protein